MPALPDIVPDATLGTKADPRISDLGAFAAQQDQSSGYRRSSTPDARRSGMCAAPQFSALSFPSARQRRSPTMRIASTAGAGVFHDLRNRRGWHLKKNQGKSNGATWR